MHCCFIVTLIICLVIVNCMVRKKYGAAVTEQH